MDIFVIGLIVLAVMSIIFYIILFSFIFYWHLVKITYFLVPAVFTFDFFAIGFMVVAITSIILKYLPDVIRATGI